MLFTKMHANGNDYIYVDLHDQMLIDPGAQAVRLCHRHFGIGGDGLVLLCPCRDADFQMRIFDPDGTEAELCGNALQCSAALYALSRHLRQNTISVSTAAGIRTVSLEFAGDTISSVSVSLPSPKVLFLDHRILLGDRFFPASYLSFGNPHCVVFTEDLSDENFFAHAPLLEKHPLFPGRANVEFVQVLSKERFRMRTWERGCGETLSCSTGTAAAVVAAGLQDLGEDDVTVEQPGGAIRVHRCKELDTVDIFSEAKIIFCGEISDHI